MTKKSYADEDWSWTSWRARRLWLCVSRTTTSTFVDFGWTGHWMITFRNWKLISVTSKYIDWSASWLRPCHS